MSFQSRKFPRIRLKVPVVFSWRDEQGNRRRARGYTRDLSPEGVFLLSPRCPPPGTKIGLEAFLPPLSELAPTWLMEAHGQVVRVEPNGDGPTGFAAASDHMVLRVVEQAA